MTNCRPELVAVTGFYELVRLLPTQLTASSCNGGVTQCTYIYEMLLASICARSFSVRGEKCIPRREPVTRVGAVITCSTTYTTRVVAIGGGLEVPMLFILDQEYSLVWAAEKAR